MSPYKPAFLDKTKMNLFLRTNYSEQPLRRMRQLLCYRQCLQLACK